MFLFMPWLKIPSVLYQKSTTKLCFGVNRLNFPGKRHPSLLSPLALGIAGACAVLLAGDWSLRATGLAAALAIAGVFLARRNAGAHRAQRLMLENYLAEQQDFGVKVVPVWAGHVETARAQMDSAVEVLAMRFSAIVDRLEQAVHVTNLSTQSIDGERVAAVVGGG